MSTEKTLEKRCHFQTDRLKIYNSSDLKNGASKLSFTERVKEILSPEVTLSLPSGWQNIDSNDKAQNWIKERQDESIFLIVESIKHEEIVGFIFLYWMNSESEEEVLRFGYLLHKEIWGNGFGTELLNGFVEWCKNDGRVKSISGGVEKINVGSIKVIEKVGFSEIKSEEGEENLFYEYSFI